LNSWPPEPTVIPGPAILDDKALAFLGRRHSADDSLRAVEAVRKAGCANLSLDLIYGLPEQSIEQWLAVLARAVVLEPEHLSCYQLTIEPDTVFGRRAETGEFALPDNDLGAEFFLATSRVLEEHGYRHYEVSSFARNTGFESRHNWKYWRRQPYLGLGPAAHSSLAGERWWNHRSVRRYVDDLNQGRPPVAGGKP
jgi:oxygen-independent coproporphyrinogen-3 oxidase